MTSTFRCSRSILIQAPAAAIAPEIADLRNHAFWSPFATPDPKATDSFAGAPGAGQSRTFAGGRAGSGRIDVNAVETGRIAMTLAMTRPVRATNAVEYVLIEEPDGTRVTWTMTGAKTMLCRIMGLFLDTDAMCGRMFEEGLAALKSHVEARGERRLAA